MTIRKPTAIQELLLTEIVVSFLVGGVPILVAFAGAGVGGIDNMLSSLLPSDTLVVYSFVLTGIAVIVDWLNRFFLKTSALGNTVWNLLDDIFSQVAPSVHTVLRIAAGVMLTFVTLWAIVDYKSIVIAKAVYFIAYGTLALLQAAFLRWLQELIAIKWVRKNALAAL